MQKVEEISVYFTTGKIVVPVHSHNTINIDNNNILLFYYYFILLIIIIFIIIIIKTVLIRVEIKF